MKYLIKYFLVLSIFLISLLFYFLQKDYAYIVNSDSMNPHLKKGEIVFLKEGKKFEVGDVITFKSPVQLGTKITHRVSELSFEGGEYVYTTKGDNNTVTDPWRLTEDQIIGAMNFSIPYVGYPILLLKTSPLSVYLLIGLLLIISYLEINSISSELKSLWEKFYRGRVYIRISYVIKRLDDLIGKLQEVN